MLEINQTQFNEYMTHDLVLVDFFATWCGPCKMLSPVLEKVQEELAGKIEIVKVDVDENMELAQQFGVMSVPTMLVFKQGKIVGSITGYQPAGALVQTLQKLL
ncbi:MAG: thioredoxin [Bacillota bacterium]|nr:thioredoxin [Bacillota bacterium]